jgi:hypothetical protein
MNRKTKAKSPFRDIDFCIKQLEPVLDANHGLLPEKSGFEELDLLSLYHMIVKYHGMTNLRQALGIADKKYCKQCNSVKLKEDFRLRHKRAKKDQHNESYRDTICSKCSNENVDKYRRSKEGAIAEAYRRTRDRARDKGLEFDLDKTWIREQLEAQSWKCKLTGIDLNYSREGIATGFRSLYSVSADRINSSKGYTKDNVRFVCNWINVALQNGTDDAFEELAIRFLENRKYKIERR